MNSNKRSMMKGLKPLIFAQLLLVSTLMLASAAYAGDYGQHKMAKADIVDVAVSAGQFNTLAAALNAAGLIDTLKGDGPFTVFAPTDAAFAKLPAGTVESLLEPGNRDKLIAILSYHVVPGKVSSGEVVMLSQARTVNGASLAIKVEDGVVQIDDANVIKADVPASNGIIHVIDSVVLPNS